MRVLFIGAHPDDIEIECGGTMAKCAKRGDTVICCHLSDGDLGHVEIMPEELGKIRREETRKALTMAGASEVIWGGFHDLGVYAHNKEAVDKVVEVIRYARPDFIVTHCPDDYMPDHNATYELVFAASFAATVPHYPCKYPDAIDTVPVFFMEASSGIGFLPEFYVDITEEMEMKKAMLQCHESQLKWLLDQDGIDFTEKLEIAARYRGYQCGVKYAEGFRCLRQDLRQRAARLLP